MTVAVLGQGPAAQARAEVLRTLPGVRSVVLMAEGPGPEHSLDGFDAVFVALPPEERREVTERLVRGSVPAFLEWPPAQAVRDAERLVRLAEEAGTEVGVSRPLRYHPIFEVLPDGARPSLILVRAGVPETPGAWPQRLADALDLCCALAGSASARRLDAEAVRGGTGPRSLAVGLRFHNATFAQLHLRRGGERADDALHVGGAGYEIEADLAGRHLHSFGLDGPAPGDDDAPDLRAAETAAFLRAVREGLPAPVSILDGLHTLRLVERLMARLR